MSPSRAEIERLLSELEQPQGSRAGWRPTAWSEFIRKGKTPCRELGELLADLLLSTAHERSIRRGALIAGLTEHPGPAARAHLEELLLSEDPAVFREDVVEALERIGNPTSARALVLALKSADPAGDGWLECKIATALGCLGRREAIPSLRRLLCDLRGNVAEAAEDALAELLEREGGDSS